MEDDQPGAVTRVEKGITHCWPIVRGIHLVDSPHKAPAMQSFCDVSVVYLN